MNAIPFLFLFMFACCTSYNYTKNKSKAVIENIVELKDFKKLIRTKTNVLVCFASAPKESAQTIKIFKDVAEAIKGEGTMVYLDCSMEAKKLCKKLKARPQPILMKHYKNGEFHKIYDRKETYNSMLNFMKDPGGDLPWEEDSTANSVIHIADGAALAKLIRRETKPLMVMFYAPWCSFCKTLKPEYASAAKELKGHSVLAAIDLNRSENSVLRSPYNITGFPTLLFFANGTMKFVYEGETNKKGIVSFMQDPKPAPPKVKEPDWSDVDSDVVHLSTDNFDTVLKEEAAVLVMFYAPWCGHCKKMKPEYEKAATMLKNDLIPGMLAAVDATKETTLASRFGVKGYPTLKFFSFGEYKFDVAVRESKKIIDFMRDPKEPPPPPLPEKPWSDEKSHIVHLTEENFKKFLKRKKHVLVIFYAPWCGHCKRAKPEFMKAAEHFQDDSKVEFAAVDCTTQQTLCSLNEVTGYPMIKYFSYYSKGTHLYTGGRTKEDFVAFMAQANPASSNPQAESKDSSVLELDESSIKDVILSKVPTMIMFHTEWCTHCKEMKPAYIQAANQLSKDGSAQLAMIDCTENTNVAIEYDVSFFPTLKVFKEGRFLENYKGERTADRLIEFVKSIGDKGGKDKKDKTEL